VDWNCTAQFQSAWYLFEELMQYLLHIHRWRQSIYYIHVRTWIKITRLFWSHHHDRLLSKHQLCRFNLSILSEQLLSQIKDLTVYYMLAFFQTPNSQRILVIAFDSCIGFDHWRRFYIYPIKDYIYPIIDVIYPIIDFIHIYMYIHASVLPITGIPHVGWREEVGAHDSGWNLGRVKGTNFTGLV
jgi:hypothetical protein